MSSSINAAGMMELQATEITAAGMVELQPTEITHFIFFGQALCRAATQPRHRLHRVEGVNEVMGQNRRVK